MDVSAWLRAILSLAGPGTDAPPPLWYSVDDVVGNNTGLNFPFSWICYGPLSR